MTNFTVLASSSVMDAMVNTDEFNRRMNQCPFNLRVDLQGLQTHQLALLSYPLASFLFPEDSNTQVKITDFGFWAEETETLGQFLLRSICSDDSWMHGGKTIQTQDQLLLRGILFVCMGYQWDCNLVSEDGLSGCRVSHHGVVEVFSDRRLEEEDSQILRNWTVPS